MDKQTLQGLQQLNQLRLTGQEEQSVLAFFAAREAETASLNAISTENVKRMVWVRPMKNVLRDDVPSQPFTRDELQAGAADVSDHYWQVPRVAN